MTLLDEVAPLAGAWIETLSWFARQTQASRSRPSRARGLKQSNQGVNVASVASRPSRARGLKHQRLLTRDITH